MSSQEPEEKILLQSDSYCPIPNLKCERKIRRRLFMSSFKREITKFHVAVCVKETAKNCTKKCDTESVCYLSDGPKRGGGGVGSFVCSAPPVVLALLRAWLVKKNGMAFK